LIRVCKEEALLTLQAGFERMSKGPISTWYQGLSIGSPTIYIHAPSPTVLGVKGCVGKNPSPTLDT